jgi:hypothetical protein
LHSSTKLPDGKVAWWSWFIIGAIGLNISNYSLAGVESGVLMYQGVKLSERQFVWHMDKSWSTSGGWWKFVLALVYWRSKKRDAMPSFLWMLLFILSVLSWAFVFSGLTMNTSSGYVSGRRAGVAVSGVNETTLNNQFPSSIIDSAFQNWKMGSQTRAP